MFLMQRETTLPLPAIPGPLPKGDTFVSQQRRPPCESVALPTPGFLSLVILTPGDQGRLPAFDLFELQCYCSSPID